MEPSDFDDVYLDEKKCIQLSTSFLKSFSERVNNNAD